MAKQATMTLLEFQRKFATEENCREHLFTIRWPQGFTCPRCGHTEYSYHSTRRLYQCKGCAHQTSLTAGTVMENTKLPLQKWFWAIFMADRDKRGVSAMRLRRELSVSYKCAWTVLHKIRKAMGDRDGAYMLGGIVELDDSCFGGPKPGRKPGRGTEKTEVLIGVSLDENGRAGFAKMRVVEDVKSETLAVFADETIAEGAKISSDALSSYIKAFKDGTFTHEPKKFDKNDETHLKWLHTIVSNTKSFIAGTYHGLDVKHFQSYLNEFCYRLNRRFFPNELFDRLLCACISTDTITYKQLVSPPIAETG